MSKVLVAVTTEDWRKAECFNPAACVLAHAIHRATGENGWLMDGDVIRLPKKDIWCETPEFINQFADYADDILNRGDIDWEEEDNPHSRWETEYISPIEETSFILDTETGEISSLW
jgi:hypothetical protein